MRNAVALGTFDGVHKGHKAVLDLPDDCKKTVVTFRNPPKAFFKGKNELIIDIETKKRLLKGMGIDEICILDFNEFKDMSALCFLDFIKNKFNPFLISCGFNYKFGKGATGDSKTLKEYCLEKGIEFKCCEAVKENSVPVSSTLIREYIKSGKVDNALKLLSEPFSFSAKVIDGRKVGRTIGFPTANQKFPQDLVVPKFGVYKTKVLIEEKVYDAITYIGKRPTFGSDYIISETHIKDFEGDLYQKDLRVFLLKFLREEIKFSSIEELKKQIANDFQGHEYE